MSKQQFTLDVKTRTTAGKGASRRMRRQEGSVPGILYGADKAPTNISLIHKDLAYVIENEAFFTSIVTLKVDGVAESAIIKDLQRHPSQPRLMHADFQRVREDRELHIRVPLHFLNEASSVGVKQGGGVVSHLVTELEIACLPKHLPAYIEVDIQALGLGHSLHISDLKLPEGVRSVSLGHGASGDLAVVSINLPKKEEAPVAAAAAPDAAAAAAAPAAGAAPAAAPEKKK
ncbi:MAG TPA: 50S ribosomal protein L25/general stress protein Ctc [Candidatus Acidoferrum sp.]|nr:50S ribosomal protein L25/general stress protein Ctc [Candidatus Acidoferrum sp.]